MLGTTTAPLLLERLTPIPPDSAGEVSDTLQVVVLVPVSELAAHERELIVGETFALAPLTLIEVVFETVPCVPINVTVCEVVTADTLAVKLAFLDPDGTVIEEGTVTTVLLLARVTANPVLGAAEVSDTVQESVPAPIMDDFAQLSPESEADWDPLPCSLIVLVAETKDVLVDFTLS